MREEQYPKNENLAPKKVVVKFGGSNLKQKEDFARLVRVVSLYREAQYSPIVIVVSALYGVTDILVQGLHHAKTNEHAVHGLISHLQEVHYRAAAYHIQDEAEQGRVISAIQQRLKELARYLQGIHYLGEIPDFASDRVLSYGERLSSLVLSSILQQEGFPCRECLPEDLGLYTNGTPHEAEVDFTLTETPVRAGLNLPCVYVIPGFYGISPEAKVTLLGRGGSDYTASAIARCIDADSLDLWKDVPGFMSADPRVVDNPEVLHCLDYQEAAELSYFGARLLHPRTFAPVMDKKIPIRLFNIEDFSPPLQPLTVIQAQSLQHAHIVKSVTFNDDLAVLKLLGAGVGIKPGILAQVTTVLQRGNINIKSVVTAQTCIDILLAREDLAKSRVLLENAGAAGIERMTAVEDISLIALVGNGILEQPGIAARALSAVSRHGINVRTISAGASEAAVYMIITRCHREKAIKSIHQEFFT